MDSLTQKDFESLIKRLVAMPAENGWLEFKENFDNPDKIAQYISGLGNFAALKKESVAFLIWGIADDTHEIVGTTFNPWSKKKGNEDLIPWLSHIISPSPDFHFQEGTVDNKKIVLLRIPAARNTPFRYSKEAYIRVGSYLKKLQEFPDLERELFKGLASFTFEEQLAKSFLSPEALIQLLDYPSFFNLNRIPLPEHRSEIIEHLYSRGLVNFTVEKEWSITNLGALLYASDMDQFPELRRKAARVVVYKEMSRTETIREHTGKFGYATGFKGLIRYIRDALPARETIEDTGFRDNQELIPPLVVRELIANALVHQDLTETSINPLVEIFADRIEVTNPGEPLVDPLRFIDAPSQSRNPALGDELRRIGVVEEKGSGWDKIATILGENQLPPAEIEVGEGYTKVIISGEKSLNDMDKEERVSAVYQQACLNYVNRQDTNNASIRRRFGIEERNKARASRILKEAWNEGRVVPYDPDAGPRNFRYVPFWAATSAGS